MMTEPTDRKKPFDNLDDLKRQVMYELNQERREALKTGPLARFIRARILEYRDTIVGERFQSGPSNCPLRAGHVLTEADLTNMHHDEIRWVVCEGPSRMESHARLQADLAVLKDAFQDLYEAKSLKRGDMDAIFLANNDHIVEGVTALVRTRLAQKPADPT